VGLLAKSSKAPGAVLTKLPENSRFSLRQWAAFSLRYPTAWSNFRVALGALRLQLSELDLPTPRVWGWGGGTTLAELDLARRFGCDVTMLSGSDAHLRQIESLGIRAVDRRRFGNLVLDEARYAADAEYKGAYQRAEGAFLKLVHEVTQGEGVSIFLDYIGAPVARATLKSLARQGVIASAGWKLGMGLHVNRAVECIARHTHVHTHYARHAEHAVALAFASRTGWLPEVEPEAVYDWEDMPRLAADFAAGRIGSYFPVYRVNPS